MERSSRPRAAIHVAVLALVVALQAACAGTPPHPLSSSAPQPLVPGVEGGAAVAADRSIVPHDLLQVTVFEAPEVGGEVRVSETGEVSLPLVGVLRAGGRTPRELEDTLVARLSGAYLRDPHVSIQVKEQAPQPIYVLGEVNQAGAYGAGESGTMTLVRAVALARGLKPGAAAGRTVVIRTTSTGERLQVPVNLGDVLRGRSPDVILEVNDVVYVPNHTGRAVTLGVLDALVRVVTYRPGF